MSPADTLVANALARSRAATEARTQRSQQIRERFAAALEAFGADHLAPARDGFAAVLAADPNDREARTMLTRTERAITTRVQDLLRRAELLAQAGQIDEAPALIGQLTGKPDIGSDHGGENRVLIKRRQRAQIDHFEIQPFLLQRFRGIQRRQNHRAKRDD